MNSAVTGSSYMNPQEIAFGSYMNPQEIAFGSYRKQLHEELGSCMNSAVTGSSCRKQFAGKMAHVLRAVKAVCTCSRGEIK